MNITIAADIAPNKIGSWETQTFLVAKYLQEHGASVKYLFTGEITDQVCERYCLKKDDVNSNLGEYSSPEGRTTWLREISRNSPDIIWLHFFPIQSMFTYNIRKKCPKSKICMTDHISKGFPKRSAVKEILCRIRDKAYTSHIDKYFPVSKFVAQRLIEVDHVSQDLIQIIYNGVDINTFKPSSKDKKYITTICQMKKEKGPIVLLEALCNLKKVGVDVPCRFVGTGPELDKYREYALANNLSNVEFLGQRDDVNIILEETLITIVPSLWPEAFGLSAAESLASGVPVIASDIAGLPEVVDHNVNGLLIPPGDPLALEHSIMRLYKKPELIKSMSEQARKKVLEKFNVAIQSQLLCEAILN